MKNQEIDIFKKITTSIPTKKQIIELIENGNITAIQYVTARKNLENTILVKAGKSKEDISFENQIKDLVREEIGERKIVIHKGFQVLKAETGTKYDFSKDIIHCQITEKINLLKIELKQHENLLKNIDNKIGAAPTYLTSKETGENYQAFRVEPKSTSSYKILKSK